MQSTEKKLAAAQAQPSIDLSGTYTELTTGYTVTITHKEGDPKASFYSRIGRWDSCDLTLLKQKGNRVPVEWSYGCYYARYYPDAHFTIDKFGKGIVWNFYKKSSGRFYPYVVRPNY